MPPNYHSGQPLRHHERVGALVVLAAVIASGAGLGVWEVVSDGGRADGKCVSVSAASSTGGALLRQCGAAARGWCASEARAPGALAEQIRGACRRAGFLGEGAG